MDKQALYRQTRKFSILDAIFVNGYAVIIQGFIVTGLALQYGSSELLISIIGVLPVLSQLIQLIAPAVVLKIGSRKKALMLFVSLGRLSVAFIPVTLALGITRQSVLLIILSLISGFNSMASTPWISIMKEAVPEGISGRFYGTRNLLCALAGMLCTFVYSLILDNVPGKMGFIVVTSIAVVFSIIDTVSFVFHYASPDNFDKKSISFKLPLKDIQFRKYLLFSFVWQFSIAIASPFFAYHQIVNLNLEYSFMSLMNIITSILSMLFYILWGKISDDIGCWSVINFSLFFTAVLPLTWFFTNSSTIFLIPINAIFGGIIWSAVNLTMFTTMLNIFPENKSESYFALLSFVRGTGALAGSAVGGIAATYLKNITFEIFGLDFYGIQLLFLSTAILRMVSWLLLKRVKISQDISVPKHIYNITTAATRRTASKIVEHPFIYTRITSKKNRSEK